MEHSSLEDYGKVYFDLSVKKSALFSKAAVSVTSDKLLCWSSDAIKKSLCVLSSAELSHGKRFLFQMKFSHSSSYFICDDLVTL